MSLVLVYNQLSYNKIVGWQITLHLISAKKQEKKTFNICELLSKSAPFNHGFFFQNVHPPWPVTAPLLQRLLSRATLERQAGSKPASPGTLTMNSRYLGSGRNLKKKHRLQAQLGLRSVKSWRFPWVSWWSFFLGGSKVCNLLLEKEYEKHYGKNDKNWYIPSHTSFAIFHFRIGIRY